MSVETERAQIPEPHNSGFKHPKNHNRRAQEPNLAQMYRGLADFALLMGDVQARQDYLQMAQMFDQDSSL